jgi:hypothetical protein
MEKRSWWGTSVSFDLPAAAAGLLLLAFSFTKSADAGGPLIEYYRMYPGLDYGDLYQYGMHFDEASVNYGARDFNRPGDADAGKETYFRVQLSAPYQAYPLVFRLTHLGNCGVEATAGFVLGGQFYAYAGERFHYIHLTQSSRAANNSLTNPVSQVNASVYHQVGKVAIASDTGCSAGGYPHLHQSADLSPTTPIWRYIVYPSGETCWTSNHSGNTWQCSANNKLHADSPNSHGGCGSYSGYLATVSGGASPDPYRCEEWSYKGQTSLAAWGSAQKVFYVVGPQ